MAFPTYINKGTFQSSTIAGGTTPSLPASIQNGDLLIAVVSTPNDTTLISADGDWTLLTTTGTGTVGTAGAIDVWVFYARYTGVALGKFSTTDGRLKCQQVYAFRNAKIPTISATSVQATAATAWTLPSITTTDADSFVFFAIGNDRDANSTANVSGYTNSNLTNITELHDETVNTGVGGGIATVYAEEATPSSIGTTSATSAASNTAAFITFAISRSISLTADPGTYSYTGTAANTLFNRKVVADAGTYSYAGTDATTLYNRVMPADSGTYSYTGTDANVLFNRTITADPGTYSYAGTDATTLYNRVMTADSGVYSYAGTDATLTYATLGSYTLVADSGTYSYSGTTANILYNRIIAADSGTYSYSGTDADARYNRILTADSGTYSYSGTDADVLYGRKFAVAPGVYSYFGTDAVLTYTPAGFSIYLGASQVNKIYLGTDDISKIFLGTTGL